MIKQAPKFNNTKDIKIELDKIPNLGYEIMSRDKNLYANSLVLVGTLNRDYEFTDSAIWAIDNNRPQTAANMLRALIETLGLSYYACEQIHKGRGFNEEVSSLMLASRREGTEYKSINILTYLDKAKKMFPRIRDAYDDASEMAHPNSASLTYVGKPDDKKKIFNFALPFYDFRGDDKSKVTNQVGEYYYYIQCLSKESLEYLKNNINKYE